MIQKCVVLRVLIGPQAITLTLCVIKKACIGPILSVCKIIDMFYSVLFFLLRLKYGMGVLQKGDKTNRFRFRWCFFVAKKSRFSSMCFLHWHIDKERRCTSRTHISLYYNYCYFFFYYYYYYYYTVISRPALCAEIQFDLPLPENNTLYCIKRFNEKPRTPRTFELT